MLLTVESLRGITKLRFFLLEEYVSLYINKNHVLEMTYLSIIECAL
jgi:hypothetical protein